MEVDLEEKKAFHDKLLELRLKQAYYILINNKDNKDIAKDIVALKKTYAKMLVAKNIGGKGK